MKVGEENCLEGCVCWVLVVYGVFKECGERVYSVCDVMSIVDLCLVSVMWDFVQWLWRCMMSPWINGWSQIARMWVV